MATVKDSERTAPAYLRFFQKAALATREAPIRLHFDNLATAQAARAELNGYRAMLRKKDSDHYSAIRDVTLRLEENLMPSLGTDIVAHPKQNTPLLKALDAIGLGGALDEDLGEDYLDDLLK